MTEATQETGITVAVEHGAPLVVFDLQNQEPIDGLVPEQVKEYIQKLGL